MTRSSGPNRREVLGGLGAPLVIGLGTAVAWPAPRAFAETDPFTLGVASGDPATDGFVIWTRLAPDPLAPDGGLPAIPFDVEWQVSRSRDMAQVERRGTAVATPDYAHSVHVEVEGLQPGRTYFYRFRAGAALSTVGRVKTLPAAGAARSVRFASAGCQHYEDGWFTAWRRLAEDDPDFVIHYGDYIYEGNARRADQNATARPVVRELPGLPRRCRTLADFRNRYSLYKLDPDLQFAHASLAFVPSFDDHEVEDGWAAFSSFRPRTSPADLKELRAAGFQAWYEHSPVRKAQRPQGASVLAYRGFRIGGLANILVLDTRQYRSPQICGGVWAACPEASDPGRTMLGPEQERWVDAQLGAGGEPWTVLAQQVPFGRLVRKGALEKQESIMDHWDGAEAARRRLLDVASRASSGRLIVLSGDAHQNRALELRLDPRQETSRLLGAEFVATSIASGGDGIDQARWFGRLEALNPHLKYMNQQRGYVLHSISRERWRTDFRVVEQVSVKDLPIRTAVSFRVDARTCELTRS